jgi:hypothetical protein
MLKYNLKIATMRKYYYNGLWNSKSVCGLEIIEHAAGNVYVILTELEENPGTPITNVFTSVSTNIFHDCISANPNDITWIEHYAKTKDRNNEFFSLVKMAWDNSKKCYYSPRWWPCDPRILKDIKGNI